MAVVPPLQMNWQQLHKRKGGPLGLKNLGNTCYLNSVLQCLTYTPPLANFCLSSNHSSSCSSSNNGNTSGCPFCLLEKRIVRSLNMVDGTVDSPLRIQSCLYLFAKHFRDGRQEDAHEFLRYVIEACNSVCVKMHRIRFGSRGSSGKHGDTKQEPYTVVKEIFGGSIQSQVKCLSCGAESNKTDDIMDLSLDILQLSTLKDAISRFFQPEMLDGNNMYRCDKCKRLSVARKQMSLLQPPNVLVIQLKRFENIYGGKIDRFIKFEEYLELSGHMCKANRDVCSEYALYAIIVHAGYSQEGGHYYSFVKNPSGKWFCCNDAHVSSANSESVLSEKAYVLFYVRKNVKPKLSNDQKSTQNGHAKEPVGPSMRNSVHVQKPLLKEKFEGKTNAENFMTSSLNRAQTKPHLKFSISKMSNGHVKRCLDNENGTVMSEDAMDHKQTNVLHVSNGVSPPLSVKPDDKVSPQGCNDDQMVNGKQLQSPVGISKPSSMDFKSERKQCDVNELASCISQVNAHKYEENVSLSAGQTADQLVSGKQLQCPVGRSTSSSLDSKSEKQQSDANQSASCTKQLPLSKAASIVGSARISTYDERDIDYDEALRNQMIHANAHSANPINSEIMCYSGTISREQDGYLLSEKGKRSSAALEVNGVLAKPTSGVVNGPDTGTKRARLDDNTQLNVQSNKMEVSIAPPDKSNCVDPSELDKLKLSLEKEGRDWLQRCGWCEKVRVSMQRRMAQEAYSGTLQSNEKKRDLILAVQEPLRKQVPNELKGHLLKLLQAFFIGENL